MLEQEKSNSKLNTTKESGVRAILWPKTQVSSFIQEIRFYLPIYKVIVQNL